MDIIYTAAFKPYLTRFPWASVESFTQSWRLSVLWAQREFPESRIQINCFDDEAEQFFSYLDLPGVEIHRIHIDWNYGGFWVLPKLYSYAAAPGAFLHLDHDVFLHPGFRAVFDSCLSNSEFMFQQPEGMSIYMHGRIASETGDGLSYWSQHATSYPNVGVLFAKHNRWAKRLKNEVEGFIQRNAYYCTDFQSMLLALCLEQQPLGVISSRYQTSWLLANEAEWGAIMNVEPSAKRVTHFMGAAKIRPDVVAWLDSTHQAEWLDYQPFDHACDYLRKLRGMASA